MPPKHHHHHQGQKCGGCLFSVTGVNPTHCCNACNANPGNHGPMCKKQATKCQGCDSALTGISATHCCMACHARPGHHGPMCKRQPSGHAVSLKGAWKNADAADVTLIDQVGDTVTCTNAAQGWSPAIGHIAGNILTFKSGLVGLTGTVGPCHRRITFSNGCTWVLV